MEDRIAGDRWEEVVMQQSHEIAAYFDREYEKVVQTMYERLVHQRCRREPRIPS
jgi:hypothetical protein